jgi:hypothetical protein
MRYLASVLIAVRHHLGFSQVQPISARRVGGVDALEARTADHLIRRAIDRDEWNRRPGPLPVESGLDVFAYLLGVPENGAGEFPDSRIERDVDQGVRVMRLERLEANVAAFERYRCELHDESVRRDHTLPMA